MRGVEPVSRKREASSERIVGNWEVVQKPVSGQRTARRPAGAIAFFGHRRSFTQKSPPEYPHPAAKHVAGAGMISREELYELVWSVPMVKVAEKFNVSGSYMARICSILHVPRPERG